MCASNVVCVWICQLTRFHTFGSDSAITRKLAKIQVLVEFFLDAVIFH